MTGVVIGGNAAGMSAASRIVRKERTAQVIVFEKTNIVSYGACGLPFYIGGVNDDIELVKMRSPEAFRKSGVDLKILHEVIAVDTTKKDVTVRNLDSGEQHKQGYDTLLISIGSKAILPRAEGRELNNAFVLTIVADAD